MAGMGEYCKDNLGCAAPMYCCSNICCSSSIPSSSAMSGGVIAALFFSAIAIVGIFAAVVAWRWKLLCFKRRIRRNPNTLAELTSPNAGYATPNGGYAAPYALQTPNLNSAYQPKTYPSAAPQTHPSTDKPSYSGKSNPPPPPTKRNVKDKNTPQIGQPPTAPPSPYKQ